MMGLLQVHGIAPPYILQDYSYGVEVAWVQGTVIPARSMETMALWVDDREQLGIVAGNMVAPSLVYTLCIYRKPA